MKRRLIFSLLLAPISVAFPVAAHAGACETKVCIQVVTDPATSQIVITAMQNKPGATAKPRPRSTAKRVYTPRAATPKPVTTKKYTPHPYVSKKPVLKKATQVKPKVTAAVSLSDRLTQLLPQRNIFFTPKSGAVVQVPMYFYTDATTSFSTTSQILGINVGVNLTPLFTWNFGDGTVVSTTSPGAPYPDTTISHTYKTAGTYKTTLTISWAGTWTAESNTYQVLGGNIIQTYSATYVVSQAPTKFIK
jgi:hypothetical protein